MIISASRRTDIPSYYSDWFYNRIKDGYVMVRNPMNIHQVSKITLSPDVVDCIVFWTKNPAPMLDRLDELKDYNYYFQFTLNAYGKDVEQNVPSKGTEVMETFKRLSDKIGPERVVWRYDPILLNGNYTIDYHTTYFEKLASKLSGYTEKCTISFIDFYKNITSNVKSLEILSMSIEDKRTLAKALSEIAFSYNLKMDTCAEDIELNDLKITHARCIDDRLIEKIIGCKINTTKDPNQRLECGCVASIDIGLYNTCLNGCKYCYANHSQTTVQKNFLLYNTESPMLCSELAIDDKVNERVVKSLKEHQISLF